MTALEVTVLGVPVSQGSMKSLGPRRLVHSNDAKLRPWRQDVAGNVQEEMQALGLDPLEGPVEVHATFTLPRPKSAPKRRWAPEVKPDIDKLLRALLDACKTGGAYGDDAQVITVVVSKVYAHPPNLPGVTFTIAPAERGEQVAA